MFLLLIKEMYPIGAYLKASIASDASLRIKFNLVLFTNGLRIMTPSTSEIASLEENRGSYSRPVMH
jgi:hypothetical protein